MRNLLKNLWIAVVNAARPNQIVAANERIFSAASSSTLGTDLAVRRALAYVGIFTRVAQEEKLSVGHVLGVARGRRTSKRVIDAIVREVQRIESQTGGAL